MMSKIRWSITFEINNFDVSILQENAISKCNKKILLIICNCLVRYWIKTMLPYEKQKRLRVVSFSCIGLYIFIMKENRTR